MLYKSFSEISEDDTNSIPSSSLRCETRQLVSGALVLVCVKAINQSVSQSVNQSVSQSISQSVSRNVLLFLHIYLQEIHICIFQGRAKLITYLKRQ